MLQLEDFTFLGFELENKVVPSDEVSDNTGTTDTITVIVTGSEVAERTLGFVESTRDDEGDIAWWIDCGVGDECVLASSEFSIDSSLLSLAYRDLGKISLADSEFDRTITACTQEGFCGVSSFDSILDSYERTGNEEHKNIIINSKSNWIETAELGDDSTISGVINLAKIYSLDGDEDTITQAEGFLETAKSAQGELVKPELENQETNEPEVDASINEQGG